MKGDTAAGNLKAQRVQGCGGVCIAYFLFIVVAEHPIQETSIKEKLILSHSLVPHGGHIASAVKKLGGACPWNSAVHI